MVNRHSDLIRRSLFSLLLFLFLFVMPVRMASSQEPVSRVPLRMAWGSFDPLVQSPAAVLPHELASLDLAVPFEAGARDYYLLQFAGPIHAADKAAVSALGAELLAYVPEYAFIARIAAVDLDAIASLETVRWVGAYHPGLRLSPALRSFLPAAPPAVSESLSGSVSPLGSPPSTVTLDILFFSGEDASLLEGQIEALGGVVEDTALTSWRGKIRASLPVGTIWNLALMRGILWVDLAPEWQLHNEKAHPDHVMDVEDVWSRGYHGEGQTVAIADTQLDTGVASTVVEDFKDCATGAGASRVTIVQLGTATSDTHGHGTHVAGSVLGNGRMDAGASTCNNFAGFPAGSAPEAAGYFQGIMDMDGSLGGIPNDLNDLFTPAHTFGARIHTNSWGSDVFGQYTASSQEADQFSWDNQDFLILFSAGNDGVDSDADGVIDLHSIGSPATAKNVVTVGASENDDQGTGTWSAWYAPVTPISTDARSDDVDGMSAFSSRGPTDDGRTKPDIVAPGTFVNSVCSTQTTGGCAADYVLFAGTSMATPLTAGAAVVARQVYSSSQGYPPTAAMLKSLLANGATDMHPGQYGTGADQEIPSTRPTHQAGWGRVDLEDSLFESGSKVIRWWDASTLPAAQSSYQPLATSEVHTYTFEVLSSGTPLAATLAWTDYPGTPAAAGGLVNDLDLLLTGPGGPVYANNAAQRQDSELIDPVGGAFTHVRTPATGDKYAMEMDPTQYPAVPAFARLWFYNQTGLSSGSVNFDLVLYDDDGAGPGPNGGTVLCTLTGKRASWGSGIQPYATVVDLSACAASIPAGVFYLSIEFTSSPTSGGRFLMRSVPGLAFQDTGGGWSADGSYNYAWAATVYDPVSPATSYDRVNNLVGIDLPSPSTGVYTLTVNGFNVPQDPQPYGLTVAGDYRLLGTETVTQTIGSTGVYTFANADLTVEFVSENIDMVSVTTYRDQFPTTGMNSIKRYFEISASGGLGTFDANLTFGYEQAEFTESGIPSEVSLNPFRFNGTMWIQHAAASRDTTANAVTVNGVTTFSRWTLGSDAPTALTLETLAARSAAAENLSLLLVLLAAVIALVGAGCWAQRRGA